MQSCLQERKGIYIKLKYFIVNYWKSFAAGMAMCPGVVIFNKLEIHNYKDIKKIFNDISESYLVQYLIEIGICYMLLTIIFSVVNIKFKNKKLTRFIYILASFLTKTIFDLAVSSCMFVAGFMLLFAFQDNDFILNSVFFDKFLIVLIIIFCSLIFYILLIVSTRIDSILQEAFICFNNKYYAISVISMSTIYVTMLCFGYNLFAAIFAFIAFVCIAIYLGLNRSQSRKITAIATRT